MADFQIVEAELWHAEYIGEHMRQADIDEIKAWTGGDPLPSTVAGLSGSTMCWTAMVDGVPAAIFGVYPISALTRVAAPWLLGTDMTKKVRRRFITEGKKYVDEMLRLFPVLINYVDKRNDQSIRWLMWLGFDFVHEIPGKSGDPFLRFEMRT